MQTTITLPNHTRLPLVILPAAIPYQPQESHPQLWETGPEKWVQSQLIDLIQQAQQMICVQSFIMDDNPVVEALTEAANRGIAIFVTGATVKLNPPEEEPEFRRESYQRLLESKFKGRMLFRAADHFHAKFVLIDPTTQPQGVLLTANLTS
ncbi:MAG: phospholipase D-like domain-containing protein [Bacteroidota bacterium]